MEGRRLAAALYGWLAPPCKTWAATRARELARSGERVAIVIWFDGKAFDASALESAGEAEYAVRRASGAVERSPRR